MKNLFVSRGRILRAIKAELAALFLAATLGSASAAPVYTSPYYTLSGSTVTGSGSSSAAYFNDTGTAGYKVDITSGADLSDATNSEIEIDHGTVVNMGTLTYTGSDYNLGGVILNSTGTVNNSGTITAPDSYSVQVYGSGGTINNVSSGDLNSEYGTYFAGTATVFNGGTINATDATFGIGIESGGIGTIRNTGTITGSIYGVQLNFDSTSATSMVTNSGTISGAATAGVDSVDNTIVTNSGAITSTGSTSSGVQIIYGPGEVNNLKGGTISGGYQGVYFFASSGATVTNAAGASIKGSAGAVEITGPASVTNAGLLAAVNNTIESQGVYVNGSATISNTGAILLSQHDLAEGVLILSGDVANAGSVQVLDSTTAYGIEVVSTGTVENLEKGKIVAAGTGGTGILMEGEGDVTNAGSINGGAYGVQLKADDSTVTSIEGVVAGATDSILLAGSDDTVTVKGSAVTQGTIEGSNVANGNVLHFGLTGLTATQKANFKSYIATHTNSGSYTVVKNGKSNTYTWADFANVTWP